LPFAVPEAQLIRCKDGTSVEVLPALRGAEARYEDWIYLRLIEREWSRPLTDADRYLDIDENHRPSSRALVILLFWTYFETRIERLFLEGLQAVPSGIARDLLQRYGSVGSRLERLYKTLWATTYWADLQELGFASVSQLLQAVQLARNDFMHGKPEAINDALVEELVCSLGEEHESWIAVFNRRAVRT
jgi:hypothetical protein